MASKKRQSKNRKPKSAGSKMQSDSSGSSSLSPVPEIENEEPDVNSCGSMPAEEDCPPAPPAKKSKSKEETKARKKSPKSCGGSERTKKKVSQKKKNRGGGSSQTKRSASSARGQKRKNNSSGSRSAKRPKCGKNSMAMEPMSVDQKPPNAFLLFFHETLRNRPGAQACIVARDASRCWSNMSESQRQKYFRKYCTLCKKCRSCNDKNKDKKK